MFLKIEEYIKKTRAERCAHLDLSTSCIEIGGNSSTCRGLLAHFLKTTIPYWSRKQSSGEKVYLCHACNNAKCSNPVHLYWGTAGDNMSDALKHGTRKSTHEYMRLKKLELAHSGA